MNTHVFLVDWFSQHTDDYSDNAYNAKEQDAEVQVVHSADNRGHCTLVAARYSGIAAFGNESNKADD